MKLYSGRRGQGVCEVTVNGKPLDPRLDLHAYSENGFEWGYDGSGPLQLALAILAEHFTSPAIALEHHRRFLLNWVIAADDQAWSIDSADIDRALNEVIQVSMTLDQLLNKVRGKG